MPQAQKHQIQAVAATYTTADNLNPWARPVIEPASSWILVVFVNCWATKSLPNLYLYFFNGCTCGIWHFPAKGLNISLSWDLHSNCNNARSFHPLCQARGWTCTSIVTWTSAIGFLTHCALVETVCIICLKIYKAILLKVKLGTLNMIKGGIIPQFWI